MASTATDLRNDIVPLNANKRPTIPSISQLWTAINGTSGMSTKYPTLSTLGRNDLIAIVRKEGITVAVTDAVPEVYTPSYTGNGSTMGPTSGFTPTPDNTAITNYNHTVTNG